MSYKRATLISEDNPKVTLCIAVKDNGDVFLKVKSGKDSSQIVHLAKGTTREDILYNLSEIVDTYIADAPIGHVCKVDGIEYVVTKAPNGSPNGCCDGCAFEHMLRKCPDIFCLGEERIDGLDVYLKEK